MANNSHFRLAARNTSLASRHENISQENALMRATIEELSCKASFVFLCLFSGNVSVFVLPTCHRYENFKLISLRTFIYSYFIYPL